MNCCRIIARIAKERQNKVLSDTQKLHSLWVFLLSNTYLSKVAASMYLPFGENFTKDTGGLSSSTVEIKAILNTAQLHCLIDGEFLLTKVCCLLFH